jgi:hypothetical protein
MTQLHPGAVTGVGSLPHRDARDAAEFSLTMAPELPFVPTLPRRSPAENMIAQAVSGIRGVDFGQYGSLSVDVRRIDPLAPVVTDLEHDAYLGMRSFVEVAAGRVSAVKWQFVGPISLGVALMRAGVPASPAFAVAVRAVREHVQVIHRYLADALPGCEQVVVLDEPSFPDVMDDGFPIPPDAAIDLLSGALAVVEPTTVAGVHCCGDADWVGIIAAGPDLLSLPVRRDLLGVAGYLSRFLDRGGIIIWGAVPTDGPIFHSPQRHWRELTALWEGLVEAGCDRERLIGQALLSPECGLGLHGESVATGVFNVVGELSRRVRDRLMTHSSLG